MNLRRPLMLAGVLLVATAVVGVWAFRTAADSGGALTATSVAAFRRSGKIQTNRSSARASA